jgi:vitamin B12 transporter
MLSLRCIADPDFILAFYSFFKPLTLIMKKEKKVWAITLFALGCISPDIVCAQLPDTVRQLDEIVITATRSEQPVISVPRSVTVITRDEIESKPFNSVGELLSNQPGMYVVGANQVPGTNQSLFMRGANSNQIAVLIDGTRITDPSTPGSTIDLSEISLTNVERIEIIRGAHSTLFGGAAVGGAINIITRNAAERGLHGSVALQGGTFGQSSAQLSQDVAVRYGFGNGFYLHGAIFNQAVSGMNATIDTIRAAGVYKTADDDDFRKRDAYVKAGYVKGNWNISTSFKNVDQRADIDDGAYNDDDNAFLKFERQLVDYRAAYKVNNALNITAFGSWSRSRRELVNDSSVIDHAGEYDATYFASKYFGTLWTNEIMADYTMRAVRVTAGAGQYSEDMRFDTYYFSNAFGFPYESRTNYDTLNTKTDTRYAFAQVMYELGDFGITVGSRYSHHSRFGGNWTYAVSPSYRIGDMLIYGSITSGFNAPSLYQLFDPTKSYGAYTTRGNAQLRPEESVSFEAGVKKEFVNGSYLTLSAFHSRTKNAIEYVYLWNGATEKDELSWMDYAGDTYINVASQEIDGIEAATHVLFGKFFFRGNVTLLSGNVSFSPGDINVEHTGGHHVQPYNYGSFLDENVETSKLIRKPRLTGFAEAGFRPVQEVTVSATLRHAGSRFDIMYDPDLGPYGALGRTNVKTYSLLDIGATWKATKRWTLSARVDNVLDESYQEIRGFRTRGRSISARVLYSW